MTDEHGTAPTVNDEGDPLGDDSAQVSLTGSSDSHLLRPAGKRSRKSKAGASSEEDIEGVSSAEDHQDRPADTSDKDTTKKPKKKTDDRSANPFLFIYNYLKQVVLELRKVIWPNRKQMITYTGIVLAFLIFMVILVAASDFGFTKLVMLVFGA